MWKIYDIPSMLRATANTKSKVCNQDLIGLVYSSASASYSSTSQLLVSYKIFPVAQSWSQMGVEITVWSTAWMRNWITFLRLVSLSFHFSITREFWNTWDADLESCQWTTRGALMRMAHTAKFESHISAADSSTAVNHSAKVSVQSKPQALFHAEIF